jgi:hypothetical protein
LAELAERLIVSIRRGCLDYIVVFGEAHLRILPTPTTQLRTQDQLVGRVQERYGIAKDEASVRSRGQGVKESRSGQPACRVAQEVATVSRVVSGKSLRR